MSMIDKPIARRSLLLGAAGAAAAASLPILGPAGTAHAADGLELIEDEMVTSRLNYLRFKTDQISWDPAVNVLLPNGYTPNKRYPVLYLLHGGVQDFRTFDNLGVQDMAHQDMIIVMPDGGVAGWYSNPIRSNTGPKNWETFHISQLIPFIDSKYSTHAEYAGRAVGGFSMGGFGALKYTAKYYGHFSAVTAFSGPADLRFNLGAVAHWANESAAADLGVTSGIYGMPWNEAKVSADNPMENIDSFQGKRVSFYSGSTMDQEHIVRMSQINFSKALNNAGIGHNFTPFDGPHHVRPSDLQFELDEIAAHLKAAA